MNAPCVILDIGGVLELTPPTGWQGRWERRLGLADGAVRERLADVWRAGAVGEVREATVHAEVGRRLGLGPSDVEVLLGDLWAEYLGSPNTELIGFVRTLPSSVRLGILSNSFVGAREREAQRYGFDELVEEIVYSHEIGVCKPDPRAYRAVCARLGVRAADCLFVDDVATNVAAARDAGMQALLFRTNAEAASRIRAHVGSPHGPRLRAPTGKSFD
jgi:HAD superfamily hydrolase (TIGR01509 family)